MKLLLNLYPPYRGAGITVEEISPDWKRFTVAMKLRWYNRNIVKTHFGGSLYSMVDPHYMLMLMNILGPDYVVWDKSATIDFLRPGKGLVRAHFEVHDSDIEMIRTQTADGASYLHEFQVSILNHKSKEIARVKKVLYIKKRAV